LLVAGYLHGSAAGCDTPVYRYAMYRWFPRYELYYFFDGQPDAEATKSRPLSGGFAGNASGASLMFLPVDVQKDKDSPAFAGCQNAWGSGRHSGRRGINFLAGGHACWVARLRRAMLPV
jgi:hypothetical protein